MSIWKGRDRHLGLGQQATLRPPPHSPCSGRGRDGLPRRAGLMSEFPGLQGKSWLGGSVGGQAGSSWQGEEGWVCRGPALTLEEAQASCLGAQRGR